MNLNLPVDIPGFLLSKIFIIYSVMCMCMMITPVKILNFKDLTPCGFVSGR
jgi:hypothetical protein